MHCPFTPNNFIYNTPRLTGMDTSPLNRKPSKLEDQHNPSSPFYNDTTTITIDLAKDIFQVAFFNKYDKCSTQVID